MSVKIITDNCCDLPPELIREYDIDIVYLTVRFGTDECDPKTLDNATFYRMMAESRVLPTTSQPSQDSLSQAFEKALQVHDEVISIHLSSAISGTVEGARMAAKALNNPHLHIFDSKKASTGQGLLVLEAARMAKAGKSVDEILERLKTMQRTVQSIFTVSNLEYLIKGGRISRVKGLMAGVFDIKPILHLDQDGAIQPYDKVRGHRASLKKLLDIMEELGHRLEEQTAGICHSVCPEEAQYLYDNIKARFGCREIVIGEIGPIIGSHVGPGTFAVFFESK